MWEPITTDFNNKREPVIVIKQENQHIELTKAELSSIITTWKSLIGELDLKNVDEKKKQVRQCRTCEHFQILQEHNRPITTTKCTRHSPHPEYGFPFTTEIGKCGDYEPISK